MEEKIRRLNENEYITDHSKSDYPLAVYYVEPKQMYLNRVRSHWHSEIEIDFVREGNALFQIGDKTISVKQGEAIYISPDHLHQISIEGNKNCVILSLIFHPRILFPISNSYTESTYLSPILQDSDYDYIVFDKSDPDGRAVLSYLEEIISYNFEKDYGYELMTISSLCQLWLILIQDFKKNHNRIPDIHPEKTESADIIRIKNALTFIQTNFAEQISLDDIAASIHVSKSECCRCFKRAIGQTPFEYLMRYRILQAATLMLNDQRKENTIADIAFRVGFNNASYFNKLFKTYFDCTPSEFRKKSKTEHRDKLSHFGLSLSHI